MKNNLQIVSMTRANHINKSVTIIVAPELYSVKDTYARVTEFILQFGFRLS